MVACVSFLVRRDDIRRSALRSTELTADGGVIVRIDHFALTANNITYAAFGDRMAYWDFFPAEAPFGSVPVWGFGDIVASETQELPVGERIYGYVPMSSHVRLTPGRVGATSFVDLAPHRGALTSGYNQYWRVAADPVSALASEAALMLLRSLFLTAFAIDDFVAEARDCGRVLLSSASSKTAAGAAFLLSRRPGLEVVGLTSPANLDYVQGLGCYDLVLPYEAVTTLPNREPIGSVDMSGAGALREAVHGHFSDSLRFSCAVGATSWDRMRVGNDGLPGPRPVRFFVPAQVGKRVADWGAEGFAQAYARAFTDFLAVALSPDAPWIVPRHGAGGDAVARCWDSLVRGAVDPRDGHILSLN